MQIAFSCVAILGLIYIMAAKRRFDFFSLAYVSACVYFMPGFFGDVIYPSTTGNHSVQLVGETYAVMLGVLATIAVVAALYDKFGQRAILENMALDAGDHAALVATALACVGFVFSLFTTGTALFTADKVTLLTKINRWQILWENAAILGAALAFVRARWALFSVSVGLLAVDLFIGFRVGMAIAVIALFVIWLSAKSEDRFIVTHWRAGLAGAVVAYLFFVIKYVYVYIRSGNLATFEIMKESAPHWYLKSVFQWSEPFTTQAILNATLENHLHVGMSHFYSLLYVFVPFATVFGLHPTSFYDLFQPVLFHAVANQPGAMGNNIWAEMISSGGWALLAGFLVLFCAVLVIGSRFLRSTDPEIRAGAAVLFTYWAFYIHRNDALYQLTLEKRVLILWCASVGVAMVLNRFLEIQKRVR